MQFALLLIALAERGRDEKAIQLMGQIKEQFHGIISDKELLKMDVSDIAKTLKLSNNLLPQIENGTSMPFETYIKNLQQNGFFVSVKPS
ncbi:MAG: hypothetical protein FWD52_00400 [Candidatus Bathyarchaeota archaeon]|nr:hypothetical protein [Candidatus Termiticorpusculum sp.]